MKLLILKLLHKIFGCWKPYPDFPESEIEDEPPFNQWSKCWVCKVCGKQWRALLTGVDCAAIGGGTVWYDWYEYSKHQYPKQILLKGENMTIDKVSKVLEKVAREIREQEYTEGTLRVLEERLGPLLRAGQAMRDFYDPAPDEEMPDRVIVDYDAALATLEKS